MIPEQVIQAWGRGAIAMEFERGAGDLSGGGAGIGEQTCF